jgi:hypothetical protein
MYLQVIINCELRFVEAGLESEGDGSALAKTEGQHDHANVGVVHRRRGGRPCQRQNRNSRDRGCLFVVVCALPGVGFASVPLSSSAWWG